jgi:hypothetical protein
MKSIGIALEDYTPEMVTQVAMVNPDEIVAYEQAIPQSHIFSKDNLVAVQIYLKSDYSLLVDMNMEEFEAAVDKFYQHKNL